MNREECCKNKRTNLEIYLGTLLSVDYNNLSDKSRGFIVDMHKHLKDCEECRDYCLESKRELASNTIYSGIYSPENFRLLRENEKVLNGLV